MGPQVRVSRAGPDENVNPTAAGDGGRAGLAARQPLIQRSAAEVQTDPDPTVAELKAQLARKRSGKRNTNSNRLWRAIA